MVRVEGRMVGGPLLDSFHMSLVEVATA